MPSHQAAIAVAAQHWSHDQANGVDCGRKGIQHKKICQVTMRDTICCGGPDCHESRGVNHCEKYIVVGFYPWRVKYLRSVYTGNMLANHGDITEIVSNRKAIKVFIYRVGRLDQKCKPDLTRYEMLLPKPMFSGFERLRKRIRSGPFLVQNTIIFSMDT